MNIVNNNLSLNQEGFEFGDDFDKISFLLCEIRDIVSEKKKYISTKEIIFCGFLHTSTFYFKDGKLEQISLYPVLRKYLSTKEFKKHDANAAFIFSKRVVKSLEEKYSKLEESRHKKIFLDGNTRITLSYGRDFDGFDLEITKLK